MSTFKLKLQEELNNPNTTSERIVDIILYNSKGLHQMKTTFVDLIETLENRNFRANVCTLAVSLLKGRIQYERIMKLIRSFATEKDSIPRSLRVTNIELTPAMASVRRNQEFLAIEDEAKSLTETWQKGVKKLFQRVKILDRKEALEHLCKTFFDQFLKISHAKSVHAFTQFSLQEKRVFKDSNKIFHAYVWI